ncbi:sulfite exporter TauE/SafE family protein [Oceaniglobus indicus]|uniref:sulfite exporter TauE/SafE family protein n=1 Tax=Oceaniglobus indicus TaxID=2047749 RepID=UPI000C18E123|nr:sulfite exporter TauE/SafE family protein [Oceaniglobus indicus]
MDMLVLILAGLFAGALNAVAGGGTFVTFPALVWLGIAPISANATATLTAVPGYVLSAWAFRRDVRAEGALRLRTLMQIAVAGGAVGALLLMVTPGAVFAGVVPWLLGIATLLFAVGPALLQRLRASGRAGAGPLVSGGAVLAVSVYGGYFNGGLGIMLLATFGLIGFVDIHGMNGLKSLMSAILSVVSAVMFIVADLIAWDVALILALATATGGYIGAKVSRRIVRTDLLRGFVVAVGAVMTVLFFLR